MSEFTLCIFYFQIMYLAITFSVPRIYRIPFNQQRVFIDPLNSLIDPQVSLSVTLETSGLVSEDY